MPFEFKLHRVHTHEHAGTDPSLCIQGDTETTQSDRKRARKEKKEKNKKETNAKLARRKALEKANPAAAARKPVDSTADVIKAISKNSQVTIATPSASSAGKNTKSKQFFSQMQENANKAKADGGAAAAPGKQQKAADGFVRQSSYLKL